MTESSMEKTIEEGMRNAAVPESITARIRKTTEMITAGTEIHEGELSERRRENENGNPKRRTVPALKRSRKVSAWWKVPAAAAVAIFCTGITVYAAAKLYQFRVEQSKAHQITVGVTSSQDGITDSSHGTEDVISVTEVPDVTIDVSYVPEGLKDNSAEKGMEHGGSYIQEDENGGYFINEPMVMDMTEASWTADFVKEYEMVQVNGRESLYIAAQYGTDTDWVWKDLCIPFPEVQRIVLVQAWGRAPKEELIKIAEGISLTRTDETVSAAGMHLWSDYVAYKNTDLTADASEDQRSRLSATKDEMQNLHEIGESYRSIFDDEFKGLSIKVTDMRMMDDVSLLKGERIPDSWNGVILQDGTLGRAVRAYYRDGDGVNTLNEVIRTEEVGMKLVYITLEYTNTSDTDMENVYFWASLLRIKEEDGLYTITDHSAKDTDTDGWEYEPVTLGTGEVHYFDIGNASDKNYIPMIPAGRTKTVHVAWLVGEDETDGLYLSTCDYGQFTDNMLKEGLVRLN